MANMTREEHITRAMLLGRVYDPRDNSYCFTDANNDIMSANMLDADTLTPLAPAEAWVRRGKNKVTYD